MFLSFGCIRMSLIYALLCGYAWFCLPVPVVVLLLFPLPGVLEDALVRRRALRQRLFLPLSGTLSVYLCLVLFSANLSLAFLFLVCPCLLLAEFPSLL
jgi:hypothetical protein